MVTLEQDQKRCVSFSSSLLQKEQSGLSFIIPIFVKKSLVDICLCRNLN